MKVLIVLCAVAAVALARPGLIGLTAISVPGSISIAPAPVELPKPVEDTPEVVAARAQHLAAVAEARSGPAPAPAPAAAPAPAPEPVQDTAEVSAARASHLAAVEEAKTRAANPAPADPAGGPALITGIPGAAVIAAPGLLAAPGLALPAPGLALSAPGLALAAPGLIGHGLVPATAPLVLSHNGIAINALQKALYL